jgi:protein gp37
MAATTSIAWTSTVLENGVSVPGATFNPWRGCTKIAQECAECYADDTAKRNPTVLGKWGPNGTRVMGAPAYWKEPIKWNAAAAKGVCPACSGKKKIKVEQLPLYDGINIKGEVTYAPCSVCRSTGKVEPHRRRVFCASMADVFEDWPGDILSHTDKRLWVDRENPLGISGFIEESPQWSFAHCRPARMPDMRAKLFQLIDATPHLDWLLLTKRPENIRPMWPKAGFPDHGIKSEPDKSTLGRYLYLENVWLGTSAGTQESADKFLPPLLGCRGLAPILFVSCEPMLGPVDLRNIAVAGTPEDSPLKPIHECRSIDALEGMSHHPVGDGALGFKCPKIDWLIIGVESSGPRVGRLGDFADEEAWLDHATRLNKTATRHGVAVFNKQVPVRGKLLHNANEFPEQLRRQEFPKRSAAV